jgi:ECF transporter S component (folate family)
MNAKSIKDIRTITGVAMFCAVYVVLSSFNIYITPMLRITFGYLAVAASCYFFGIAPNLIAAFITDFLGWVIHPEGAYFFGYAVNAMFQALVYGWFFYRKETISWKSVITARALVVLVNNLILNPLWLSIMYGDSWFVLMSGRIVKNLVCFPIDCILLMLVLRLCLKLRNKPMFR